MYAFLTPFLENPTGPAFLEIRRAVLEEPGFSPWASDLENIDQLIADEAFESIISTIRGALWPSFILSPGAHIQLGFALHKTGQAREANLERALGSLLLRGIEMTGDGTESKPFLVTRVSDEYDFLFAKQMQFAGQTLIEVNGCKLDRVDLEDGGRVYFDVTDIQAIRQDFSE